jgi:hypothetical protein
MEVVVSELVNELRMIAVIWLLNLMLWVVPNTQDGLLLVLKMHDALSEMRERSCRS